MPSEMLRGSCWSALAALFMAGAPGCERATTPEPPQRASREASQYLPLRSGTALASPVLAALPPAARTSLDRFLERDPDAYLVIEAPSGRLVHAVGRLSEPSSLASGQVLEGFLAEHRALLRLSHSETTFAAEKKPTRSGDFLVYRLRQHREGIPVIRRSLKLSVDADGRVAGLSGAADDDLGDLPNLVPTLSGEAAARRMHDWLRASLPGARVEATTRPVLAIHPGRGPSPGHLLWRQGFLAIVSRDDHEEPRAFLLSVDAHTGDGLGFADLTRSCTDGRPGSVVTSSETVRASQSGETPVARLVETCYSSWFDEYFLEDHRRSAELFCYDGTGYDAPGTAAAWFSVCVEPTCYTVSNGSNTWASGNRAFHSSDFRNAKKVLDVFLSLYGRNGADGDGENLIIVSGVNYDNATAMGIFRSIAFGKPDYANGKPSYGVLDVAGHEFGHIVQWHEWVGIFDYGFEGSIHGVEGAVDEHMSDMLGIIVNHQAADETWVHNARWGHALERYYGYNYPKRNDPRFYFTMAISRNYYRGTDWSTPRAHVTQIYTGPDDAGGVHTNAVVLGRAVYLYTEGGYANRAPDGTVLAGWPADGPTHFVSGIGMDKMSRIAYHTVVTGSFTTPFGTIGLGDLTQAEQDYAAMKGQLERFAHIDHASCLQLSQSQGWPATDCLSVRRGYAAVGLMELPPEPPVFSGSVPGSPSRTSTTPTLQGVALPQMTVQVYTSSTCSGAAVGSGTTSAAGAFAIQVSVAPNSTTTFYAATQNGLGEVSACSTSHLTYVHDSLAPSAPAFTGTTPASPSRTSTTPTIRGTAEAGATVRLYPAGGCGGAPAGSGIASAGQFGITVTVTANSSTTFYATATDAAGNISFCSPSGVTYVHDNVAPGAPVLLGTDPASPSNASLRPTLSGTAEAGTAVRLYTTATCTGTVAGSGVATGGAFGIPVTVAANATTTFYGTATDAAGNTSRCGSGLSYVHDNLAPSAPLLTGTTPASPSNTSLTPSVNGAAEAQATVRLYSSTDCTGPVVASGVAAGGAFSIAVTVLADSSTTFRATATDAAGNTSPCSPSGVTYVHDARGPEPPVLSGTTPVSPSNATTSPIVTGSAEPQATVQLYWTSDCSGPSAGTSVATAGAFAVAVSVPPNSSTTFFATATDAAGNTSRCSELGVTFVHDDQAPSAPVLTGSEPASPTNASVSPTLRGTAEEETVVTLYLTPDCGGPAAGSGVAASGAFEIAANVSPNSSTTFFAMATDAAGNVSPCSSSGLTYVHDGLAPSAPVLAGTTPTSPSPDPTPIVRGTAETGTMVRLHLTPDCRGLAVGAGVASGGLFGIEVIVGSNTSTTFYATARDAAGNESSCSANGVTYVHDSIAPAAPILTGTSPASPSGSTVSPTVNGTAEAGATVRLYTTPTCTGVVAAAGPAVGGSFGLRVTVAPNTRTSFYATATDPAGNASPCSTTSVVFLHDSAAPAAPVLTRTAPLSPSRSSTTPTLLGTAEAGATLRIYAAAACAGPELAVHVVSAAAFGISLAVAPNSSTTFTATATDAAGNVSPCSAGLTYVHDDLAPSPPVFTGTEPASPSQATTTPSLRGMAEGGSEIRIYTVAGCSGPLAGVGTAAGGTFQIGVVVAPGSTTTFYGTAIDAAGNVSSCSPNGITYVHGVAPALDGGTPGNDGGLPVLDGGTPSPDAGVSLADGGSAAADGGPPGADGGGAPPDGGLPAFDGGSPGHDAGTSPGDAGISGPDAGAPAPSAVGGGGCGCAATGSGGASGLLYVALVWLGLGWGRRRTRRSDQGCPSFGLSSQATVSSSSVHPGSNRIPGHRRRHA